MSTDLEGRTIVRVRPMRPQELVDEAWEVLPHEDPPPVIELDDGTTIYPARDNEGNGPGALFGKTPAGQSVQFSVREVPRGSDS